MRDRLSIAIAIAIAIDSRKPLRHHAVTDHQPAPDRIADTDHQPTPDRIGIADAQPLPNIYPDNSFHIEASNRNHPHNDIATAPDRFVPTDNGPALHPALDNISPDNITPDNSLDPDPHTHHPNPANPNHVSAPHPEPLTTCPLKPDHLPNKRERRNRPPAADSRRDGQCAPGARNGGADHVCGLSGI